ncbi:HpcH/HpaI aldolase family protein [Variovorax saccharolyticus]|uniref:HpcH/HpaI aldolase family protein n=1 Tax=Variovorax saccharolyticus TaxID=3053516 RepID=UPI002575D13C|nr:aldolase/citrate lyase family protein [Variovorax sp. J22R187]MDM0019007.1 aldolase/citrate lyase family protein [Variovorax sp. J22R187]
MTSSEAEQMPSLNRLRDVWASGACAFGAMATIPSVQTVQVLARSGLDFMIVDMEHGPIDAQSAHAMIAATGGTPLVPLVRVSGKESWHAKIPLDLGAMGVCFPMTSSREDALSIVKAVRYPPLGERLWGPFFAPLRWGRTMSEYLAAADDEILAIGVLESIGAMESVAEIARTPGLDMVFIGPGDLATSMGQRGRPDHPDVQAAIAEFEKAIDGSSIVLGGVATSAEQGRAMRDRGYRALMIGFDWSLLQRGIGSALQGMRD